MKKPVYAIVGGTTAVGLLGSHQILDKYPEHSYGTAIGMIFRLMLVLVNLIMFVFISF